MGRVNKVRTVAIALAVAIAVSVPFAIAQSMGKGERGMHMHGWQGRGRGLGGEFFGNLDLTDAQKAQMKQIRENHSQMVRPLMEQIRAKRGEIRQASQGGAFDEALVTQKLTEIAPLEAKLMGERFKIHQELLSVLTPEQKTKLEQSREQFKNKHMERRQGKSQSK